MMGSPNWVFVSRKQYPERTKAYRERREKALPAVQPRMPVQMEPELNYLSQKRFDKFRGGVFTYVV